MGSNLCTHVASGGLAAAICGALLVVLACGGGETKVASPTAENSCSVSRQTRKVTTADGTVETEGKPLQAPEAVMIGNQRRDIGLREQAGSSLPGGGSFEFNAAAECYHHALELSPENYEAKLGLGVTYLARIRALGDYGEKTSTGRSYLTAAKRSLGEAYMLRQGAYEPLYYLAEAAVLEKDYARATQLLEALHAAKAKPGPVAALLAYVAEKQHDRSRASKLYAEAAEAGGPFETLVFVSNWLNIHSSTW